MPVHFACFAFKEHHVGDLIPLTEVPIAFKSDRLILDSPITKLLAPSEKLCRWWRSLEEEAIRNEWKFPGETDVDEYRVYYWEELKPKLGRIVEVLQAITPDKTQTWLSDGLPGEFNVRDFVRALLEKYNPDCVGEVDADILQEQAIAPELIHRCHAKGCEVEVPPRMLMCKKHWAMVPKPVQKEVWKWYRPGQEIDKNPSKYYLEMMQQAIAAVEAKESQPTPDLCMVCGAIATKLCDYRIIETGGTCDNPMCDAHAQRVGAMFMCGRGKNRKNSRADTVDYCPGCYKKSQEEKAKREVAVTPSQKQPETKAIAHSFQVGQVVRLKGTKLLYQYVGDVPGSLTYDNEENPYCELIRGDGGPAWWTRMQLEAI